MTVSDHQKVAENGVNVHEAILNHQVHFGGFDLFLVQYYRLTLLLLQQVLIVDARQAGAENLHSNEQEGTIEEGPHSDLAAFHLAQIERAHLLDDASQGE